MKGIRILLLGAGLLAGTVAAASADTFSGEISDSMCLEKHEAPSEGGPELTKRECTNACVRGGSKYVLVTDDGVLQIANQDHTDLETHAGTVVTVSGALEGTTLTVTTVEAAEN